VNPRGAIRTLAVTGGTGFVGRHLLRLAAASGYDARALTRSARSPEDNVVWVDGALDRPESLAELTNGAEAVIHIAGLISGSREAFEAVNVHGTAAVIDAARKAGVRRFIHISSLAAREAELSSYGWSKERSERLVAASGLEWTIIRPPAIYGPGDRETLELFRMARRGFVALPPRGHFSLIHVKDLCRLILAVVNEPETLSELYEPDDGREGGWQHRQFARTLSDVFGRRGAALALPRPLLHGLSRLERLIRPGRVKLTADRIRYFCHPDWVVTARRRPPPLLWQPEIATADGLRATADWYRVEGWLR
jgi:uncharacterized protein YbjT (DUF2867 family)